MNPNALASQISHLDNSYNPTDVYNKVTTSLGIPDARTRVQALQKNLVDTQNAIDAVDPNVTGRTSGSLVTEAQRQRLVNMEKQPLSENYAKENQAYGTEGTNLNNLLGQATQREQLAKSGYNVKRQSLATMLDLALKQRDATQTQRNTDRTLAEQIREFNLTPHTASGGGNIYIGGGGNSPTPGGSTPTPKATTKPSTASTLRQTWQMEANKGDRRAQVALKYAGDDGRYDGKVNTQKEFDILKSLGIQGSFHVIPTKKAGPSGYTIGGF